MRGVGVSFEYFLWHFLYQIFEDGYQIFLELTVSLFCLADFKCDFMWQLGDVEEFIISFEQLPACDVGIVEIEDGWCLVDQNVEQAEYGIEVAIIIVENSPEKFDDFSRNFVVHFCI